MDSGPSFRKFRTAAFSCIALISLAWIALATVVLYMHWGDGDSTQTALIVVILCVNVLTTIMVPLLLLVKFRVWLDAARTVFLLMAHFFAAIAFTMWAVKYSCPSSDDGVCSMMNLYVVLASWVIPLLLLVYSVCFSVLVWRRSGYQSTRHVEDATTSRRDKLPTIQIPDSPSVATAPPSAMLSRPPWVGPTPPPPLPPGDTDDNDQDSDTTSKKHRSQRSSARLSKPLPNRLFT
ncbi:hypothetical protein PsYK624_113800 [Phanerochaete sordida]|uniref:MARVEL domain-containing protein n=1 Tax=Phanerochaete sordida TaxID=48140 RepID=A0A9P3LI15_9APHY|nr:hypothetical protein PsYK624_113800 [Phanerochaete sordida]